jgi:hypothetical protein
MYENRAFRGINPTTKFWLLLVQEGEGCDYTVGCGMRAQPLKAQTIEEARVEAREFFHGPPGDDYEEAWENAHYIDPKSESALARAVLITGSEFLPLDTWRRDYMADCAKREAEEQRMRDEAEFERLKRRLGK